MQRTVYILTALLLLALFACSGGKSGKPGIVVTIYPYELIVKQLVGEDITVRTLVPANISPHGFKPNARQLRSLKEADLVISNGFGLEDKFLSALGSTGKKQIIVEDLLGTFPQQDSLSADPHVWLSPLLLQRIVIQLSDRLQSSFPALKDNIGKNTVTMISQIVALDLRIRQERSTFIKTPVFTLHNSFHYFVRDYDIDLCGLIQSIPGVEPSAENLTRFGDIIQTKNIKVIYVEPQLGRSAATQLANKFKLQVIELDPIGKIYKPKTIQDVILNNWEGMKLGW